MGTKREKAVRCESLPHRPRRSDNCAVRREPAVIDPGNILEVEHLSVRFGSQEVLHDLSFSVGRGTALAVIGPNGSGKTVLFRALISALPYEGVVRWAPDARIGHVPQKLDLSRDAPIAGRDLLAARARIARVSLDRIDTVVARVGLAPEVLSTLVGTMSGGQFQRLLMACALLADPTVLLLDEPTAGVDEPGQERMNETIHRLQTESGATVLLISHELNVVFRYADTVLCLTPRHTCFGIPREVLTMETLAQVYGQPVGLARHDDTAPPR